MNYTLEREITLTMNYKDKKKNRIYRNLQKFCLNLNI